MQAPLVRRAVQLAGLAAVLLAWPAGAALAASEQPAPPYYSIQLTTVATEAAARDALKKVAGDAYARAEKRNSGYVIRVGAWPSRKEAEKQLPSYRTVSKDARVLQLEHPVAWLLPNGSVLPVPGSRPAAAAAPAPAPVPPAAVAAPAPPAPIAKPAAPAASTDLTELSLNELLDIQVTSVSKRAEPLTRAAAAVFVLTGDEIRRSGVTNIAEALRLVPGIQVYRTNAQAYTITARGVGADKLEVLLDGRSVYTPLTSTVFWDVLDTYMPDIDRIEVIRGPGATLWGANAVNGVINIVTKHTRDTVGTQVTASAGIEELGAGAFRSGSKVGNSGYARMYAKAFERDHSVHSNGSETVDGQRQGQAGFRTDWTPAGAQDATVSGDFYRGEQPATGITGTTRGSDTDVTGANLLGHWAYRPASDSEVSVQAYWDGYHRLIPQVLEERRDTGDLQLQHRFAFGDSNTVVYGAGYRVSHDQTGGPPIAIIFDPASRTLQTYSVFAQDQLKLGESGELTIGSKFEHNSSTGFEYQPGIRLGWALGNEWFTWGAVSRAVRLPNRIDEDIAIFCPPPVGFPGLCGPGVTLRIGNSDFKSEKVLAYEWGLRFFPDRTWSINLSTFYNDYTDLRSTETTPPPFGAFGNQLKGQSYGGDLWLSWEPVRWLTLRPSYSFLKLDIHQESSTDAFTGPNLEGGSPQQSAGLTVRMSPGYNLTVDSFVRYVDSLPRQQVPSYTELNLRLGWRPVPSVELALTGANLLDASHPEAGTAPSATNPAPPPPATEIQRAVWLGVTWDWK